MSAIIGHAGLMLGGGYTPTDADAIAFMARFTVPPNDTRKQDTDTLFLALKSNSIWSLSDTIYVPKAAQDQQSGLLDLKRTAKAATLNGAATWTSANGFVGSAAAGAFVNPDYVPATDAVNLALNNACYWMYVTALPSTAGKNYFGRIGGVAARATYITGDNAGKADAKIHSSAGNVGAAGNISANSLICLQRTGSTTWALYKDGVSLYTGTDTSGSLSEVGLFILALHNANTPGTSTDNSDAKIGAWGAGSQMTTGQMSALKAALDAYY